MTKTKKYLGVIDDCAAGSAGILELPIFISGQDMVGSRVTIEAYDEQGSLVVKRGKLISILQEWD